jgi:hypothetical protein
MSITLFAGKRQGKGKREQQFKVSEEYYHEPHELVPSVLSRTAESKHES